MGSPPPNVRPVEKATYLVRASWLWTVSQSRPGHRAGLRGSVTARGARKATASSAWTASLLLQVLVTAADVPDSRVACVLFDGGLESWTASRAAIIQTGMIH